MTIAIVENKFFYFTVDRIKFFLLTKCVFNIIPLDRSHHVVFCKYIVIYSVNKHNIYW